MITINGIEFDIDLMDADVMERFETAAEKIQKRVAEEKKNSEGKKGSEFMKAFNKITEDFIDEVIGDGASEQIFDGSQNMMEHMKAYNGIFEAKNVAMDEVSQFTEAQKNVYSPNRAQRRAAVKGKPANLAPVK